MKWMVAVATSVAWLTCLAMEPAANLQSGDKSSVGETILGGIVKPGEPGLAVVVRRDGKTLFQGGYGVRDLRTKAALDERTNFRLASVTKQFTAMAVMLLVHDNKLRYETTLGELFPEFPAYGKQMAVRNLLNHTSGLPDYEDLMEAVERVKGPVWSPEKQIQDAEVLQLLEKATKGKFAPGRKWDYSNSGYVMLGLVVAKVSGKSYGEFLHERIFAPLKMTNTVVFQKGKNEAANRAFGYTKENDAFRETDQSSTSATLGDGGVYSNIDDLSKWDDALRNHTLLSEEEMKPALEPAKFGGADNAVLPDDAPAALHGVQVEYGFGWFLDPYKGHERMWHYGDTMGFKTAIQRFTKDGLTVIVLCNRTDLDPGALAMRVADIYLNLNAN
ncbi:MAG TPA: serine hydrolase domain-containing protein [Candidatus Dormibacteraeota bacterium]|jgi:CubicO group peptidase (beta-lactamase class C family)|nr:serine hydrolase domain-containing protein [Candidatus Dormibacteraeota bacterium]